MRIITKRSITECWNRYPDSKPSLAIWEERMYMADCRNHEELKKIFSTADYIPNPYFKHLTLFNIKGNDYRLGVDIFFNTGHIFLKWFGKHSEYDNINFTKLSNEGFRLC
ncbi:MAG: type II toxin-antitoxin system HigB family toxin [Parachlamydiaceae bacterium]|nr:type II toxin-antitoxin system HigB family toxin [Parachlamydiaceae bacterium]